MATDRASKRARAEPAPPATDECRETALDVAEQYVREQYLRSPFRLYRLVFKAFVMITVDDDGDDDEVIQLGELHAGAALPDKVVCTLPAFAKAIASDIDVFVVLGRWNGRRLEGNVTECVEIDPDTSAVEIASRLRYASRRDLGVLGHMELMEDLAATPDSNLPQFFANCFFSRSAGGGSLCIDGHDLSIELDDHDARAAALKVIHTVGI